MVENLHMHMMLTTWLMGCTYSVCLYMLESVLKPKTLWWKKNLLTFVYQNGRLYVDGIIIIVFSIYESDIYVFQKQN